MKDTKYKGIVKINGKPMAVYVVDGVRYIDGKTVDKFYESLDEETKIIFANKGLNALKE